VLDNNWELISGEEAHEIEVLNYANQVNVIEALVRYILFHAGTSETGCPNHPNLSVLREFHRTATLFLLKSPGEYREGPVYLKTSSGELVYTPPRFEEVDHWLNVFATELSTRWKGYTAVQMGSYVLWFINWVHPFKNGNGRTARAFCYACVSLKMGFVLPGEPTLIDLVMQSVEEYQLALREGDISFGANGEPDLTSMNAMVERLLIQQLDNVPEAV